MEQIFLIINWLTYGLLFGTFFIKLTDDKIRDIFRKIAYLALTLWSLYMAVLLFKICFILPYTPGSFLLNTYQTITNMFFLWLMWTKVKEDKLFTKTTQKK